MYLLTSPLGAKHKGAYVEIPYTVPMKCFSRTKISSSQLIFIQWEKETPGKIILYGLWSPNKIIWMPSYLRILGGYVCLHDYHACVFVSLLAFLIFLNQHTSISLRFLLFHRPNKKPALLHWWGPVHGQNRPKYHTFFLVYHHPTRSTISCPPLLISPHPQKSYHLNNLTSDPP